MLQENKPWARLRVHGPAAIFDWHESAGDAQRAIAESAERHGQQVHNFQTIAYFPDRDNLNGPEEERPPVSKWARPIVVCSALDCRGS